MVLTLISPHGIRMAAGQNVSGAYDDPEAYAVLSAILEDEWPVRVAKAQSLVIQVETTDYPDFGMERNACLAPPKGEEHIYEPVIAAYREINKKIWRIQRRFSTQIPYELVSKTSIAGIFAKKGIEGWKDFYAKYPDSGGSISMSAVAFNADKTVAIAYMGHSCGGLCGGGTYHIMRKTDGKWSATDWKGSSCSWAS